MDKTIEVVLVAVVVIATAAIMLFIVSGQSGTFSDFISNSISDANDTLEDTQNGQDDQDEETGTGTPPPDNPTAGPIVESN